MQRLRSGYSLLEKSPRAQQQDDPHKDLEQFCWAQILSIYPPTAQLGEQGVEAFDYQNGVAECDEPHSCTDLGTSALNPKAVEYRSDVLEQGDVMERPHDLWGGHLKEHDEAFDYQKGVEESDDAHKCTDTTDFGTRVQNQLDQDVADLHLGILEGEDVLERDLWSGHRKEHLEERNTCTEATDFRTRVQNQQNQDVAERCSGVLELTDVVERELWSEHRKEHSEEASVSPLSSISSNNESEASYGPLQTAVRRRQIHQKHFEGIAPVYESKAFYKDGGRLDRPLQTKQRHLLKNDGHSKKVQLPYDISSYYDSETSYNGGGRMDRPDPRRQRRIQTSDEYSETASSPFDVSYPGREASYDFDILAETLQRDVESYEFDGLVEPLPIDVPGVIPYPVINPYGSVSLLLRHLVRVDVTPEGSVCIHHVPGNSIITTNSTRDKTCLFHPNSRVFQDGPVIHAMTYNSQVAKICDKGIVFAPSIRSLGYRVDESGPKTTYNKFFDMRDVLVPMDVFYDKLGDRSLDKCPADDCLLDKCHAMVASTSHRSFPNGDDVWSMGDAKIKQDCYGNVEVSMRDPRKRQVEDPRRRVERHVMRVLPVSGDVSVQTPRFSADVGCYPKQYLSVRIGNSKLTSGVGGLTAMHGSQKAGLDRNKKVVIF